MANQTATPLMAPPNGEMSNFVDPPSRATLQIAITATLLGIAMFFYLNRMYVKIRLMRRVAWDDAALLFAMLLTVVYFGACTWAVTKGKMGRRAWNVTLQDLSSPDLLIPLYMSATLPPFLLIFLKTSFFLFYLQIFNALKWVRYACYAGIAFVFSLHTGIGIYWFVAASPYNASWIYSNLGVIPLLSLGLMVDIYILAIPIVAVNSLQMERRKKMGAMVLFVAGGLACVFAVGTIITRVKFEKSKGDALWAQVPYNIFSLCEIFVGIICVCTPSLAFSLKYEKSIYRIGFHKSRAIWGTVFSSQSSTVSEGKTFDDSDSEQLGTVDPTKSTDRKYARYFKMVGTTTNVNTVQTVRGNAV
ncbi:hypothetical protein EJ04DRAFT_257633 [Polyplosphaeria fusca]|uniref:Rhodopsin domain-containing protein n=1 Tax=Polyplosphaeria fusca TaxID=682080 RepID=A0A9P4V229_9PLEO|nr:hypothetical protein EJ04DRAFT_257633 [Polyplosphaeria fusca]